MLYVVGWCERNSEEGRSFFDEVAGDGGTSPRAILFGALEIDPPDLGAERIVQLIRENRIEADRVVGRLQGRWLRGVSEAPLVNVELVAGSQLENSGQIPALLEMRLHGRLLGAGTLADFAWRCLEAHPTLDGHMRDYHSDHLAGRLASLTRIGVSRCSSDVWLTKDRGSAGNPSSQGQIAWFFGKNYAGSTGNRP